MAGNESLMADRLRRSALPSAVAFPAVRAETCDGEVRWVDLEPGVPAEIFQPIRQPARRHRGSGAAAATDYVLMSSFGGKVVDGGTMAEMAVHEQAGLLERIQCAINSGLVGVHLGVRLDCGNDRSHSQMLSMALSDNGAHRTAGPGDAEALTMEGIEECLWGNMHPDLP